MKKAILWFTAAASMAALADSATWLRLSWSVPADSIYSVRATYVNLYAEVGGVRVGCDGRATPGAGDVGVSATTVVRGDGGWDWTGKSVEDATFAVEFLNGDLSVVAVSSNFTYSALAEADAFSSNESGSAVPSNGETPCAFNGVFAGTDGVWEYLKEKFAAYPGVTVVPLSEDDAITDYVVTFTNGMAVAGPLSLNVNLGKITIDLNGGSILGTNAVAGAATSGEGGDAVVFSGELAASQRGLTELEIVSGSLPGYKGTVAGGDGVDGTAGTKGGYAFKSDVSGVKVTVGSNVVAKGGDSGDSVMSSSVAGQSAANENVAVTGTAADGADGTAFKAAWAWAVCTGKTSDKWPAGTYFDSDDSKVWFFKRVDGVTNADARAVFDFAALSDLTGLDGVIHFVGGTNKVDQFLVPASAGSLEFVGVKDSTVLSASPLKSAFSSVASSSDVRKWKDVAFVGLDAVSAALANGGAIDAEGGALKLVGCSFENCGAAEFGGAVCARLLAADSVVDGCDFSANAAGAVNGWGGALYASAASADLALLVTNCAFEANAAENGGAICAEVHDSPSAFPVALEVACTDFSGNSADWTGGAIDAEGDLFVDADATHGAPGSSFFTNNVAGVAGGAVEINGTVSDWKPAEICFGRGVRFVGNVASNGEEYVSGGAVDVYVPGCVVSAEGVEFTDNVAYGNGDGGDDWNLGVHGGAFCAGAATNLFDTCVFSGNKVFPVQYDYAYFGGALELETCSTQIRNCSFRGSNVEAVDAWLGELAVTNCVIVGNDVGGGGIGSALVAAGVDVTLDGTVASFAYSAWGTVSSADALAGDWMNLSNRTAEAVYEGEGTLRLCPVANPVAALGVEQAGVYDFADVEYGSLPAGSSMGAYECATVKALLTVTGDKVYDGSASSNGISSFAFALTTNGAPFVWSDLATNAAALASKFMVTNWTYASRHAGSYSTDAGTLVALVGGATAEIGRWMEMGFVDVSCLGVISRRPVDDYFKVVCSPGEYPWTGSNVVAAVTVSECIPGADYGSSLELEENVDYALSYADNVDPTSSAKAKANALRDWTDEQTGLYAITAYFVEYSFDGVVDVSRTETVGETSGVAVAVSDLPAMPSWIDGYAWDWQYSTTNGTVTTYDNGLLRLKMVYRTDSNEDGVPDVYQKQVLAKVANGDWSTGDANDVAAWATLTNSAGKWAEDGTGSLAGALPSAGSNTRGGFTAGGWLVFENGSLKLVSDPSSYVFSAGQIPVLVYAYAHGAAPTSGTGRGTGRGGRGTGSGTAPAVDVVSQYTPVMTVKEVKFTSSQLVVKAGLVVRDNTSGDATEVPVDGAALTLYCADELGGDWTERKCVAEEGGVLTVDLTGKAGFYKVGL